MLAGINFRKYFLNYLSILHMVSNVSKKETWISTVKILFIYFFQSLKMMKNSLSCTSHGHRDCMNYKRKIVS